MKKPATGILALVLTLLLLALCLGLRAAAALGIGGPEFAAGVEGSRLVAAMDWIRL